VARVRACVRRGRRRTRLSHGLVGYEGHGARRRVQGSHREAARQREVDLLAVRDANALDLVDLRRLGAQREAQHHALGREV